MRISREREFQAKGTATKKTLKWEHTVMLEEQGNQCSYSRVSKCGGKLVGGGVRKDMGNRWLWIYESF